MTTEASDLVYYQRELDRITYQLQTLAAIAVQHGRPYLADKIADLANDVDQMRWTYRTAQEKDDAEGTGSGEEEGGRGVRDDRRCRRCGAPVEVTGPALYLSEHGEGGWLPLCSMHLEEAWIVLMHYVSGRIDVFGEKRLGVHLIAGKEE